MFVEIFDSQKDIKNTLGKAANNVEAILSKERLRAAIFKSAETVYLILLCNLGDAVRCAVSAALKMAAHNCPLILSYSIFRNKNPSHFA